MLRFISRLLGLLILAAGFAWLVIDGTRSIAGSEVTLTPFSMLFASKLPVIQQALTRNVHPLLWDPVATSVFRLPIWLVLGLAGLFLLWIARRRAHAVVKARDPDALFFRG
jgi:hypothetical protein